MRFGKVYLSLPTLDVFEPDFVIQVNAPDGGRRYYYSHQIACGTAAPSPPMIDAQIAATLMEKPSTQCAAG
jgi:hypothetical protein